ncbi:MAG: hypothetical protein MI784_10795 [Cytophagales bacterium]|nr:hypothetical protein [Cytophagales bacterium]
MLNWFRFFKKRAVLSPVVEEYIQMHSVPVPYTVAIDSLRLVFVCAEAEGVILKKLAAVPIDCGAVAVSDVLSLNFESCESRKIQASKLEAFLKAASGAVLMCSDAEFPMRALNRTLQSLCQTPVRNRVVDYVRWKRELSVRYGMLLPDVGFRCCQLNSPLRRALRDAEEYLRLTKRMTHSCRPILSDLLP